MRNKWLKFNPRPKFWKAKFRDPFARRVGAKILGQKLRYGETGFRPETFINEGGVVWERANQKAPLSTLIGQDVNRFITQLVHGRQGKHALKAVRLKVYSPRIPCATLNTANSTWEGWWWCWWRCWWWWMVRRGWRDRRNTERVWKLVIFAGQLPDSVGGNFFKRLLCPVLGSRLSKLSYFSKTRIFLLPLSLFRFPSLSIF